MKNIIMCSEDEQILKGLGNMRVSKDRIFIFEQTIPLKKQKKNNKKIDFFLKAGHLFSQLNPIDKLSILFDFYVF